MQFFSSKPLTVAGLALMIAAFGAQAAYAQDTTADQSSATSDAAPAPTSDTPAPTTDAPPAAAAPSVPQLNNVPPPPEGKGQVVFFRPSRLVGAALSYSVREGDTGICKLTNGSYCIYITDPGTKEYNMSGEVRDTLRMEIEEGETYYVTQAIGVGIVAARPNLTPSTEAAFQQKRLKLSTAKPTDRH